MKKLWILGIICIMMASLVFAAQGDQGQPEDAGMPEDAGSEDAGQPEDAGMEQVETQQQNQGEEQQIQEGVQTKARSGEFTSENGKKVQLEEQANNRMQIKAGNMVAQTGLELEQEADGEKTKLKAKLSNGKFAEIKIMPDTASEKALERLRMKVCSEENSCQIELKEVGQGEEVRATYELKAQKQARLFGIFGTKMQVEAQVSAENGEIIRAKKPWWAFLASEPEE